MITGQEEPTNGKLTIGETVKLGYMEQSRLALDPKKSVYDVISGGNEVVKLGKREVNGRTFAGRFNFTGTDQQKSVSELSGGERNRVQLALLIREEANVILLDEPTNDLDINTLRALEEALGDFPGCAVIISHDRWFLDRIATHILAFEGDSKITLFEGGYSDYEKNRRERLGREADTPHRIRYAKLKR
jgi:ATPase subunit of ABC transporter with duplicated ATPase domains